MAEDGIALRRLNAQPGKTYYFRAQVLRSEGSGITLLDTVDEEQAQFLLQTSTRPFRTRSREAEFRRL